MNGTRRPTEPDAVSYIRKDRMDVAEIAPEIRTDGFRCLFYSSGGQPVQLPFSERAMSPICCLSESGARLLRLPNARTERQLECGAGAAALSSCRDACKLFAPVPGWADGVGSRL
jgi:hypothetical protein